jgi:hypothetical protein
MADRLPVAKFIRRFRAGISGGCADRIRPCVGAGVANFMQYYLRLVTWPAGSVTLAIVGDGVTRLTSVERHTGVTRFF